MKKFALYNFSGKPTRFYGVTTEVIATTQATPSPTHHIAVIDVSGSMYGDLEAVKSTVEKVFTAEEFNNPAQRVSLLTYASNGDCRIHFQRVTVADVLAPNSPHLREIRGLRTRGMTGISQALKVAETLVNDSEVTCISLHTDGYANDPSPFTEAQGIVAAVDALSKHPNAFCNTVGYRSYCDFALLNAIANRLSGTCTHAQTAREVYEALHKSQTLLAGTMAPVIEAPLQGAAFTTFTSPTARKVLGGTENLTIRGLKSSDTGFINRYVEIAEADFNALAEEATTEDILSFCRAQIAVGNLSVAKFAMMATRITNLISAHVRAMVASEVAEFSAAVEKFLFEPTTCVFSATYGLPSQGVSVLSVLQALDMYRAGLRVNVKELGRTYKRRGLKRIAGTRLGEAVLLPQFKLEVPPSNYADVASIDINRDTATANVKVVQDGVLVKRSDGRVVDEVAGIRLKLKSFRNYTVVGDGSVNIGTLTIRTSDKRLHAWFKQNGLVDGSFNPETDIEIPLKDLPLVDYDQTFQDIPLKTVQDLVKLTALQKMLSSLTKGESETLTPEQIKALAEHNVTPSLYFSAPTTNPYSSLEDALNKGEVDTRLSYRISLGTVELTNLGKLPSANAFLQRRFTLKLKDGTEVEKPNLPQWWADENQWGVKTLSSRTKLTAVDALLYPIFADFLGVENSGGLKDAFSAIDATAGAQFDTFEKVLRGGSSREEALDIFNRVLREVELKIDRIFATQISPLAFYVGATGLVPETLATKALTAEQLTTKHPGISLSKDEKEGTFYELPSGVLLSVFTESSYFTTEIGEKAIEGQSQGDD